METNSASGRVFAAGDSVWVSVGSRRFPGVVSRIVKRQGERSVCVEFSGCSQRFAPSDPTIEKAI